MKGKLYGFRLQSSVMCFLPKSKPYRVKCARQVATNATVKGDSTDNSGTEDESSSPWNLIDTVTSQKRRWSNLDTTRLDHQPGSVVGAAALVAGTTIGAGILALPAVTKDAGFVPACSTLVAFYIFSAISGLLITEVNINTVCELGSGSTSLQACYKFCEPPLKFEDLEWAQRLHSMVKRTLGNNGSKVASLTYVFLHYALLVAYISRAGVSIAASSSTPVWLSAALFTLTLGGMCFFSSTRVLDIINSGLLALVIISFLALVALALPSVNIENLSFADWSAIPDTLPVVALAFVYQNIVPVIVSNLEGDVTKVRTAIWLGLAVPLLMFGGWEFAMLGSVSPGVAQFDPVQVLRDQSEAVGPLVESFSLLAIATSFIGFVLGLSDFFADVVDTPFNRMLSYSLTLLPPYVFAVLYPDVFFSALDLAGTYGVLVLFGLLPPAMAWSERYWKTTLTSIRVVPGGPIVLVGIGGIAAAIIGNELLIAAKPLMH